MIDFETVNIFLRNNQHVTIRPAFSSEANEVADFFKTVTEETEFLSKQADEASSPGEIWRFLRVLERSKNSLFIVAESNGKVIGMGQVVFRNKKKSRHRATVSVAIKKEIWGMGLGTALMQGMTAFSEKNGAKQLELTVMSENKRAISLYERQGFIAVGRMPNAYLMKDGSFCDEISMVKIL